MRHVRILFSIIAIILYSCLSFAGAPNYTTFQTKILAPSGLPLENPAVNFRFTILDSFGTCVLYIEDYVAVNMTGSSGVVSFSLGSGTKSYPGTATLMNEVFNNSVTVPHPCQAGGTYAPGSTDRRQIVMQFNDGSGWQTLPQMAINSVFYANYATTSEKLGNYISTDYLRPATLPSCIAGQALHFNGTSFTCVAASGGAGGVTSVNVNSPLTVVSTTSTPVISLPKATGAVSGYLSSADWASFNAKASATLNAGSLYVGNGSNAATGVTLSGDATLNSSGDLSLKNSGVVVGTYGSASSVPALTVDAKGRVTSATSTPYQNATGAVKGVVQVGSNISVAAGVISLTSNDVTNALGYTPPNATLAFVQNGNAFSANANVGTSDNYNLNFVTSGTPKITVKANGNVGIGTTTPSYKLDVVGDVNVTGNFKVNGTNIGAGGVTSVNGSGAISVVNTTTTPIISIATANGTTIGAISSSDWTIFNNKLNNLSSDITTALTYTPLNKVLSPNFIFVGSAVSVATGVAMSGDATILSSGNITLSNSATTRGNLGLGTAATFNVPVAGDASSTEVVRGTDSRLVDSRAPMGTASGDLTGSYPAPTLTTTGVGNGTYTKVTVDTKGRVTSATQFTSADVTTAMGYTPGKASQWISNSSDISFAAGNVGIGTTSTASKLTIGPAGAGISINIGDGGIVGPLKFNSPNGSSSRFITSPGSGSVYLDISLNGNGTGWADNPGLPEWTSRLDALADSYSLIRGPAGAGPVPYTSLFTVKGNGNVGIGTTTPSEKLEISGALKLGSTTGTQAGTIRWDGVNFQGYNGSAWTNFIPQAPPATACDTTQMFVVGGTYSYTVPGTFAFIKIQVWGGGGSGGSAQACVIPFAGGSGSASFIPSLSLSAGGGQAGGTSNGGAGGAASGGTVNQAGIAGANATGALSGAGGDAFSGGTGGAGTTAGAGPSGQSPGGGGAGAASCGAYLGGGGAGGYTEKTYSVASLPPGTVISDLIVGAAGPVTSATVTGGAAGSGRIAITCSTSGGAPPPGDRGIVFSNSGAFASNANFVYTAANNVGIGTTTPAYKVDVIGDVNVSGNFRVNGSILTGGSSGPATAVAANAGAVGAPTIAFSADATTGFYNPTAGTIALSSAGTNIFNFSAAGMVSPTTGGALIQTANGTSSTPTYSFAGDPGTGWYRPAPNTMGASTAGLERMRIDSSGNVGIGTTTPSSALHVVAPNTAVASGAPDLFTVAGGSNTSGNAAGGISLNAGNSSGQAGGSSLYLNGGAWSGGGGVTLTGSQNGGGGAGTINILTRGGAYGFGPGGDINLTAAAGGGAAGGKVNITGGDNGTTGGTITLQAGSANSTNVAGSNVFIRAGAGNGTGAYGNVILANSGGNVGIGTTAPNAKLDFGVSVNGAPAINLWGTSAGNFHGIGIQSSEVQFYLPAANHWSFNSGGALQASGSNEVMRIMASGNVGIGTTTPAFPLDVAGSGRFSGDLTMGSGAGSSLTMAITYPASFISGLITQINGSRNYIQLMQDVNVRNSLAIGSPNFANDLGTATLYVNGNVGIGTSTPAASLHVVGQIVSQQRTIASGATVDFTTGNVQVLQSPGGAAITLNNMVDGGAYTLIITDTTSRQYTFANCTTPRFVPANDVTSGRTVYSILKTTEAGVVNCYISWIPGF